MIRRRRFLGGLVALGLSAAAPMAAAQGLADRIVAQLKGQGYTEIRLSRTLLGRTRIVATAPGARREIIVNPRTGEILRDFWQETGEDDDDRADRLLDRRDGARGNGGRGETEDEEEDDESGNGNSGSGGHGGGRDGDDDDDDDDSDDDDSDNDD